MTERVLRAPEADERRRPPASKSESDDVTPLPAPLRIGDAAIQAKLAVGPAGDRYEREADAVADRVVASMRRPPVDTYEEAERAGPQRMPGREAADGETEPVMRKVQRMSGVGGASGAIARRSATIQRLLDPSQQAKLTKTRGELKALLNTPKGKGKKQQARKKKIAELRATVAELEELDKTSPDTSLAQEASLVEPKAPAQEEAAEVTPPAEAAQAVPKVVASDPKDQSALEMKLARLAELQAKTPEELTTKETKKIAALERSIIELTAKPTEPQTPAAPEKAATSGAAAVASSGKPAVAEETAAAPDPAPDLATESLRDAKKELADHKAKGPPKRRKGAYHKKTAALEAKVVELEAAIEKQYPDLSTALGDVNAQELNNEFGEAGVEAVRKAFPTALFKTVCDEIGARHLRDLTTEYGGAAGAFAEIEALGVAAVKDLMTVFSAKDLKKFEAAVGAARLRGLVRGWKITATALEHYKAPFMKRFRGADQTTWTHLTSIKFNRDGAISGGHDKATFDEFAADNGVRVDSRRTIGSIEKVTYTTFWPDGEEAQTGSKTLIPGLTGKKVAMLTAVNKALWNSISKCEFDTAQSKWSASNTDGDRFEGFYRNGKIDTFFPV